MGNENDNDTKSKKKKRKEKKQIIKKDMVSVHSMKKLLKADKTLDGLQVSAEAYKVIANATQHFMVDLLKATISESKSSKNGSIEYDDIANFIDSRDNLSFLSDIVPKRIKFSKAIKISNEMNKKEKEPSNDVDGDRHCKN